MINPPRERRIVFRAYLDTVEYVYADISIIGRGTGALTGIVSHLLYTARLYAALISSRRGAPSSCRKCLARSVAEKLGLFLANSALDSSFLSPRVSTVSRG